MSAKRTNPRFESDSTPANVRKTDISPHRITGVRFAAYALVFAALGDETRLAIVHSLGARPAQSITQLSRKLGAGRDITRQGVTKHLRALEGAGLVHASREGRESLYALTPDGLAQARTYLEQVSAQWDASLERLKDFVERS